MFQQSYIFIFLVHLIKTCSPQIFYLDDDNNNTYDNVNEGFVPRVVNGWPAKLGDVPYQIAFKQLISRARKLYATFCGGVIITPDKLMSAAHCFEERGSKCGKKGKVSSRTLEKTFAVAGNLYNRAVIYREGQWRRLKSMFYPRTYKFPKDDICVGRTTAPFIINAHVAPIPYTTRRADYRGKCLVSGYGRIGKTESTEILLLAHLELITSVRCSRMHNKNMNKFVCTSSIETDVGKGDSGGPLVCTGTGDPKEVNKGILVGIVSGNRRRVGSFFTRVSSYTSFIQSRVAIHGPPLTFFWMCLLYISHVLSLFCFIFQIQDINILSGL